MSMKSKRELKAYALEDINSKYSLIIKEKVLLPNGRKIDILGSSKAQHYLIQLKNQVVKSKDVWHLIESLNVYKVENKRVKVNGIIYCNAIDNEALDIVNRSGIIIVILNDIESINRVKFTTTLSEDTLLILKNISKEYNTRSINKAIEHIAKKEWELINVGTLR